MSNLVPIGRFSKISHLSVKTLRHYDSLGLLRPAHVDGESGYRYYSIAQGLEAEVITQLRALDMPLEEIRSVLKARDAGKRLEVLARHRTRVEAEIAEKQEALAYLDRLLRRPLDQLIPYAVHVKTVTEETSLSIRSRIPLAVVDGAVPRLLTEIEAYLGALGESTTGSPFVVCHESEYPEKDGDAEVGVPVGRLLVGRGRVRHSVLSGGLVAATLHAGPHAQIAPAYHALAAWIQAHGHETEGPPRENWLVGPRETAEVSEHRTEVAWPIR